MLKYNGFKDCKIERIESYETNEVGYKIIVPASQEKGFAYPYVVFVPDGIDEMTNLIVEGANTGKCKENLEEGIQDVVNGFMQTKITKWNVSTNYPVLTPAFPRFYDKQNGGIYTHMLTSQVLQYKNHNLDRIDIQLINMINDIKERLSKSNVFIDEKVILDGFSASAKFVTRFALLHPEIVKLVIAGGVSGNCILPIRELDGERLLYPIGCGNIDEITDNKIELFKQIQQFYYMGELDIDNDPFRVNVDGSLVFHGTIEKDEAEQLNRIVGSKMMPDRWNKTQQFYYALGVNAIFKTYDGFAHDPTPAKDDVIFLLDKYNLNKTNENNRSILI